MAIIPNGSSDAAVVTDPSAANQALSSRAVPADLFNPFASFRFIQNSQNIEQNKFNDLHDIYFYINILDTTGELDNLDPAMRAKLTETVLGFQNRNGGFGDWYHDRSKVGSTRMALEILTMLGAEPLNKTGAVSFVSSHQVSGLEYGNFGFRSSVKERDADVASTYDAVKALKLLSAPIPNLAGAIAYLKDHQNFDGGFGYQTNRESDVFWHSTIIHTHRGILALELLSEKPTFSSEVVNYIKGSQSTTGGFKNDPDSSATVSYTYNAVVTLQKYGESVPNTDKIIDFIKSNQLSNGGFVEYALDNKEGLHTTYYAVKTMALLGSDYDKNKVLQFVETHLNERLDGGFGNNPGTRSNVRFTFDAVSALNLIGRKPLDSDAVVTYINARNNPDGGFGEGGSSNVETTYRAVMTLQLMGHPVTDPLKTIEFIRNCQNNDGGFGFEEGYVSRGSYTYRALRVLDILGAKPFSVDGAVKFQRSLQNQDGGFGNYLNEGESDLGSTYRSVRGLAILDSKPLEMDKTEQFILDSMNTDGGFKRAPQYKIAPDNLSKSIFGYDALLALEFIDKPITQNDLNYNYIESLRNPDLGFGERPYFTSAVTSTFTAIWSYFHTFKGVLDTPPALNGPEPLDKVGNSTEVVNFTVQYQDTEGQMPEYVHLIFNGVRSIMYPVQNHLDKDKIVYFLNLNLPVGEHSFHYETTDGLYTNQTEPIAIKILEQNQLPVITVDATPAEGTPDTTFTFKVSYNDPDGIIPDYVRISFDYSYWQDMDLATDKFYYYSTTFKPGRHTVRAEGSDGENIVRVRLANEIVVHPYNSSKPDWNIFEKIKKLIFDAYGEEIGYHQVELDTYRGELVWRVDIDNGPVYVTYDGEEIINEDNPGSAGATSLTNNVLFLIILIVIVVIIVLFIIKRKRRKP
jgi:prenyltransferase beta subunit